MATSIRWPADVLAGMKQLAGEHGRSLHSEIIQACKAWIAAERDKALGRMYLWNVYRLYGPGQQFRELVGEGVEAATPNDACLFIVATKWISRLSLIAEPAEVVQEQK